MKRFLLTFTAIAAIAALVPPGALAHKSHHGKRHHKTHHAKAHRVRFERFGSASQSSTSGSESSGTAGTVQSFDSSTGKLTILLNDGTTTVSGLVTGDTSLTCSSSSSGSTSQGSDDDQGEDQNAGDGDSLQGDHEQSDQQSGEDDNGGGDDQGEDDDSSARSCDSSNLKPGAVVQAAELRLSGSGATWEKVRLAS
jgi:hypothetical protein